MELWIRSKDKTELIRTNRIYQFAGVIYAEAKEEVELGNYKTRERALEVLDEIQEFLIELDKAVIYSKTSIEDYTNVYEMPSE